MADISVVKLPSGNSYNIKDATARTTIASEVSRLEGLIGDLTSIKFVVAWDGSSTPVIAKIPKDVVVTYNGTTYTGTMEASSADEGTFYLVHSGSTARNTFDEYVVISGGYSTSPYWEKIGTTDVDLSGYVTNVSLSKQTDVVLGEATTFTASGTAVGKTTKYLSASASGTAVGADGTTSVVSALDVGKGYLTTTTVPNVTGNTSVSIPNVTSAGSASTWSFAMGTGTEAETLIISGTNSVAPTLGTNLSASKVTLGTAKTVATGTVTVETSGGGTSVTSDIVYKADPTTATALTGVKVTTQPTVTLTANTSTATGRITYVESLGTVTQPTITVGTNDKVTALTSATDVSVTR